MKKCCQKKLREELVGSSLVTCQLEDTYSQEYGKQARSFARRYSYSYRLKLIGEVLKDHKCGKLLDVGCATGDYGIDLTKDKEGLQCFLVDINRNNLLIALHKNKKAFYIQARTENLPFRSESFDFMLMLNTLRYFESAETGLAEANRVLKTEGKLILIDHNKFCPDTFIRGKDVKRYFSRNYIKNLLGENRFVIQDIRMIFTLPPWVAHFTVNKLTKLGENLKPLFGSIYPEMFIETIKLRDCVGKKALL